MIQRLPFKDLLREFRIAAGLSQEALAERAMISVNGVSALERGVSRAPQRETLALIIRALDLSPEQQRLIEESVQRPSTPRFSTRRITSRTNLPLKRASFYGRTGEVEEIASILDREGLVTLTGAGGVGKTRLAVQVGMESINRFPDGVWFVDLSPLRDASLVAGSVAAVLSVRELHGCPLPELVADALREKTMLLIVDNCEHVIDAAGSLISTLSRAAARVQFLVTSRQPLGITGERTYRVASLEIPAAIALFEERAKQANDAFELTSENTPTITEICRRLDGIPFAIELAAARLRVLTAQQLQERLSERFRVLTGSRFALPRQQTMRTLIDWSYDLLDRDERALFARLGVFAASFSFDAVTAICRDETIDEWRVIDLLVSLVDKSLVISESYAPAPRYRLLESIRAYALERSKNEEEHLKRRHAEYYATLAEQAQTNFDSVASTERWAAELELDLENFRVALDWAIRERNDISLGVRLLSALRNFWTLRGHVGEAARRAEDAFESLDVLPPALQSALWLTLSQMRGDLFAATEAYETADRACQVCEMLGDARGLSQALRNRGWASMRLGRIDEARRDAEQALSVSRANGGQRDIARALATVAMILHVNGQLQEACDALSEVVEMTRDNGDDSLRWRSILNLAEAEFALGYVEAAVMHASDNLATDFMHRNIRIRAQQECNLAAYQLALGHDDEAYSTALDAISHASDAGDHGRVAVTLQHVAAALAGHDAKRAARLLGFVEQAFARTGYVREHTERVSFEMLRDTVRRNLTDAEISRLSEVGAAMTEEQAVKISTAQRRYFTVEQ